MDADTFATIYAEYVECCAHAGIEPATPDAAAALLAELGLLTPFLASASPSVGDAEEGLHDGGAWVAWPHYWPH